MPPGPESSRRARQPSLEREPDASMFGGMRRSILTEPWQRSSRRAWALVVVVAAIGALIRISVRGLVLNANASAPADPLAVVRSREPGLRVLFIGNSFTSFNSMPTMVEQLAGANRDTPRRLFAVEYAPGGSHLANAAHDPALLRLISSVRWDIVVLQEQSQVPALPYWLVHQSLPAVQTLTRLIRRDGARPVLHLVPSPRASMPTPPNRSDRSLTAPCGRHSAPPELIRS